MRTVLLTAFDDAMEELGALTSQRMQQYANAWGMDFICRRQFTCQVPYWEKIVMILDALQNGYERVIWLDADQVITNFQTEIGFCTGFHASLDWGIDVVDDSHFSACGLVVCRDALPIIQWVHDNRDWYMYQPFPEQAAMRRYFTHGDQGFRMTIHPRKGFNCVPVELCPTAPEPWEKGDFCCHLTHVPIPERVDMFHKIIKFLNAPPEPTPDELLTTSPITNDPSAFLAGE
jgi:hypothetical protein